LLNDPLPADLGAVWVDAPEPESARDEAPARELWRLALSALNPRRNPLRRRLTVPLVFAGPMWLNEVFQHAAADLWSIRDTIIRIEPPKHDLPAAARAEMKLDSAGGQPEGEPGDPEETRRALARLRNKKVPPSQRMEHCALEARLLHRLGNQLRRDYRWPEAEDALLEAEERIEKNPRSLDDQARILFDLYFLYDDLGRLDRAEHYARKAVDFTNVHYGAEDRRTLASRNNLATTLQDQGKHAEAEDEHRAVLAIREQVQGTEHPETLSSRNNLANTLAAQGKHAEAEGEHRAVLALRERVLGAEHPETLSSRNNLANVLQAQGKYAEAEGENRAVLAIGERAQGAEHPDVFLSCFNLALILESQEKYQEASVFVQRAEMGWRKVLGADHPNSKLAMTSRERIEAKMKGEQ